MRYAWVLVLLLLSAGRAHADALPGTDAAMSTWSSGAFITEPHGAEMTSIPVPEATGAMMLAASTGTAVTPEPSSVVLMGSGLVGFGGMLWRRRRSVRSEKD